MNLYAAIAQMDACEIDILLEAVLARRAELFPDWETSIISLQKNADKNKQLDSIILLLQRMKTSP